jgi:parallel beta-helix repeat protein
MKQKPLICLMFLILLIIMVPLLAISGPPGEIESQTIGSGIRIKIDSPITIDGNAELNQTATSGNGSAGNPYILENYIIDVSSSGYAGVYIKNTDAYFIIRNCTFFSEESGIVSKPGIWLHSVSNGMIQNNTLEQTWGVRIYICQKNHVINNTVRDGRYSIRVESTYNSTVIGNIIDNNTNGIYFEGSYNCTICQNIVTRCDEYACYLNGAADNQVYQNEFDEFGIKLTHSYYIKYIRNDITPDNTVAGRPIYYYYMQTAVSVPSNASQIILLDCESMQINNCNIINVSRGISIYHSLSTTVNNTVVRGCSDGVVCYYSHNTTIENNIIEQNTNGLYFAGDYYNVAKNNTVKESEECAISAFNITSSVFTNNSLNHNAYGIYLEESSANLLYNNSAEGNGYAIYLEESSGNNLTQNRLYNNGIGLSGFFSELINNITTDNTINGLPIYYFTDQAGISIPSNASQVILVNCTGINITNFTLHNVSEPIALYHCNRIIVSNNDLQGNANGITLSYSGNCTIAHNTLNNNDYGLYAQYSDDNVLHNLTAHHNAEIGIYLWRCDNITLYNSSANFNTHGMELSESDDGDYYDLHTWNNTDHGLYFDRARRSNITYCTSFYNGKHGIYLDRGSNGNRIVLCTSNNNFDGIRVRESDSNVFLYNSLQNNLFEGILLNVADHNVLIHNTAEYNGGGFVDLSNMNRNNSMWHNTANHNHGNGITIQYSYDGTIYNNTACNNGGDGFWVIGMISPIEQELNCNLTHNYANNNAWNGIELCASNVTIQNNTCNHNGEAGIRLCGTTMNFVTIINNTLHGNLECIDGVPNGVGNLVESNDCQNRPSGKGGIPGFQWFFGGLAIGVIIIILHITKLRTKKISQP